MTDLIEIKLCSGSCSENNPTAASSKVTLRDVTDMFPDCDMNIVGGIRTKDGLVDQPRVVPKPTDTRLLYESASVFFSTADGKEYEIAVHVQYDFNAAQDHWGGVEHFNTMVSVYQRKSGVLIDEFQIRNPPGIHFGPYSEMRLVCSSDGNPPFSEHLFIAPSYASPSSSSRGP